MVVEPIPVIRAAYLNLVLDVLNTSARDYEKDLQQCHLPTNPAERPDAYVPLQAVVSFMRRAAYSAGVEGLGLRAASRLTIDDLNTQLRSELSRTARLETALQAFCRLAQREQSTIRYRIVRTADSDEVRICCSLDALRRTSVDPDVEWFSIMSLVTIVRHFAGNAWTPSEISLQSKDSPGQHAWRVFRDTQFRAGQKETSIAFPASLFRLRNTGNKLRQTRGAQPGATTDGYDQVTWDFPTSLQKLLQGYLDDGYPDINLAAKIVGSSVRTLQRRLRQHNLRYSELVHQTQIEYAMELLANKDLRTLDVAYAVGYENPSNFSRAFRRVAGLSPKQYRSQNYAH